jgi:hypothetical protein
MGTKSAWTPARRARQADIIRSTKPWALATGPRTAAGKAKSSKNATAFRDDLEARRSYLAMQMLIKDPLSPLSSWLWAEINAAHTVADGDLIKTDFGMPRDDDLFFDDSFD